MGWKHVALSLSFLAAITTVSGGQEREMTVRPVTARVDASEPEDQWILSLKKLKRTVAFDGDGLQPDATNTIETTADVGELKASLATRLGRLEAASLESTSAYLRAAAEFARIAESEADPYYQQQYLELNRHAGDLAEAMLAQRLWLRDLRKGRNVGANAVFLERLQRFVLRETPSRGVANTIGDTGTTKVDEESPPPVPALPAPIDEGPPETPFHEVPAESSSLRPRRGLSSWTDIQDAIQLLKIK